MDVMSWWNDPMAAASKSLTSGSKSARGAVAQKQAEDEFLGRVGEFQTAQQDHERTMAQDRYSHEQTIMSGQQGHEIKVIRENNKQHRLNVDQAHHLPGGSSVSWGPGTGMVTTPMPRTPRASRAKVQPAP